MRSSLQMVAALSRTWSSMRPGFAPHWNICPLSSCRFASKPDGSSCRTWKAPRSPACTSWDWIMAATFAVDSFAAFARTRPSLPNDSTGLSHDRSGISDRLHLHERNFRHHTGLAEALAAAALLFDGSQNLAAAHLA